MNVFQMIFISFLIGVMVLGSSCLSENEGLDNTVIPLNYISYKNGYLSLETYTSQQNKKNIFLSHIPQRVLTNQEGVLNTVLALDEGKSIVAASISNRYMYPITDNILRGQSLPPITRYEFTDEEALLLCPDLIIGWKSTFSYGALRETEFWNKRGIATYITASSNCIKKYASIEDECQFILDIGRIYDKEKRAQEIVDGIKQKLEQYQLLASEKRVQRVMVLQYNSPASIFAYEDTWLVGDLVKRLGGYLLFGEYHTISKEEIIYNDPEVIFVLCAGDWDKVQYESYVKNDISLNGVQAVKNNRVYGVPFAFVYAPGVHLCDGLSAIFYGLYPD